MSQKEVKMSNSRENWKNSILKYSKIENYYIISIFIAITIELMILLLIKYIPILLIFGVISIFFWGIIIIRHHNFHREKLTIGLDKLIISLKNQNLNDAKFCENCGKLTSDESLIVKCE
ncbi:MAG: hypothetical protein ACFFD2_18020 [Promethearchaeota archaeon]